MSGRFDGGSRSSATARDQKVFVTLLDESTSKREQGSLVAVRLRSVLVPRFRGFCLARRWSPGDRGALAVFVLVYHSNREL